MRLAQPALHEPMAHGQLAGPTAWAKALGYAGLLPFMALSAALWSAPLQHVPQVALALATYAALIASFLGGIHWGLALGQGLEPAAAKPLLVWGVVPALLAWPALLMPPIAALPWCAATLMLCFLVDARVWPRLGLGPWLRLRGQLSAVAILSCLLGTVALY